MPSDLRVYNIVKECRLAWSQVSRIYSVKSVSISREENAARDREAKDHFSIF